MAQVSPTGTAQMLATATRMPAPTPPQSALLEMPPMPPGFYAQPAGLTISSGAFASSGEIPIDYTCHGDNVSPALDWGGVPTEAQSLVLVMVDPDSAPPGFVHWLVYDIPPHSTGMAPFQPNRETLDNGALQGANDYSQVERASTPAGAPISAVGYAGPCPPGPHRYQFLLYALDSTLGLAPGASLEQVVAAMRDHVLTSAELEGRFTPPVTQ